MNIRVLGAHSCETQNTSCVSILIDNTLVIDAGGLTSNLPIEQQQKIKTVLLTHKHYDHIRDIPGLAINLYRRACRVNIYATADAQNNIEAHLLNGDLYPRFQALPEENPTIHFKTITVNQKCRINGYGIMALPVNHGEDTVGFYVSDAKSGGVFYSSDTGPNLSACWTHISPKLLIVDVTFPDSYMNFARTFKHLTPSLLRDELVSFRRCKGYLPEVIIVHMEPGEEEAIRKEIDVVSRDLNASIAVAHEGMELQV